MAARPLTPASVAGNDQKRRRENTLSFPQFPSPTRWVGWVAVPVQTTLVPPGFHRQ
jgi:hypothetical protein